MAKNSFSDWDTTAGNNTDVGGIPLGEGAMYPASVNNAFSEIMAQLKTTFGAYLGAWTAASSSGPASLAFAEDTDNGTNKVTLKAPASIAADVDITLPGVATTLLGTADKASTTDAQTGTDASKYITSDALAALWEKGADIASAATISLGEGGFYHVTGTTTITDIDWTTAKDGRGAWVVFDGILTLTYNATTLKLPGSANITTAAGDRAYFVQDSGDNVICLAYVRADGTAITGGGVTLLGTLTTTSGTTQSLTGIGGYKELYCEIEGVSGSSNGSLQVAVSSTNGAAYGSAAAIVSGSPVAGSALSGICRISSLASTSSSQIRPVMTTQAGSGYTAGVNVALLATNTAAAVDAVQFSMSAGNFDAGVIRVYGVK